MLELNKIYNMDCMDGMAQFPDKYFELAIVDPPYGIGFDKENSTMSAGFRKDGTQRKMQSWNNPKAKGYVQKEWDKEKPSTEYFAELFRVSKNQIVWGGNYFTDNLPPSGGWVVWEKGVPEGMSLSQAELAWTNCLNSVKIKKYLWAGYKKCEETDRFHPTQKPVALYKWLLKNYAHAGDKILDTHMGSGSSVIACIDYGFDYIAFEIDKEYFDSANERIEAYKSQGKLFEEKKQEFEQITF
jgi:site-specific DNA-methyltransferase (adenine-specific)